MRRGRGGHGAPGVRGETGVGLALPSLLQEHALLHLHGRRYSEFFSVYDQIMVSITFSVGLKKNEQKFGAAFIFL